MKTFRILLTIVVWLLPGPYMLCHIVLKISTSWNRRSEAEIKIKLKLVLSKVDFMKPEKFFTVVKSLMFSSRKPPMM